MRDFSGYADKRSTAKKVAKDVFKKGDACFRSLTFVDELLLRL